MSSESDFKVVEDDDNDIYQSIFDMDFTDERDENESARPFSSEQLLVRVKRNAEMSSHEGLDMDALDNIQDRPVQRFESFMENPWRNPGANISDYFNYGFDEESWTTYCLKQNKLCSENSTLNAEMRVQMGQTTHRNQQVYSPSASTLILTSRDLGAFTDVTEGQAGSSRSMKVHQCVSDEGNNTQVVTESLEEDRITSSHLSPPYNFGSHFPYTSPPSFIYQQEHLPPTSVAPLASENAKKSNGPPTAGVFLIPWTRVSSSQVKSTAADKAWEDYIRQEQCDNDRHRSTEHGHYKDSNRSRDWERASCSSHSSGERRMRSRATMEQRHRHHHIERNTGQNEEQHRERKHKSKRWQQSSLSSRSSSSSSSSSQRNDGEDRKSQNRYKHRTTKRSGKDKETNKMLSSDNEDNQI